MQFILENKKSKVIYVRGLENMNVQIKHLYNLFSNFGNILMMILFPKKKYCLVDFETTEHATNAKDNLNNIKLLDNSIRIFYSNYESINLKSMEDQNREVFVGD